MAKQDYTAVKEDESLLKKQTLLSKNMVLSKELPLSKQNESLTCVWPSSPSRGADFWSGVSVQADSRPPFGPHIAPGGPQGPPRCAPGSPHRIWTTPQVCCCLKLLDDPLHGGLVFWFPCLVCTRTGCFCFLFCSYSNFDYVFIVPSLV